MPLKHNNELNSNDKSTILNHKCLPDFTIFPQSNETSLNKIWFYVFFSKNTKKNLLQVSA